jgi:hypothetical protein
MARSTEAIVEPSILGELDGRCKKQGCLKPPASLSPAECSRRTANFSNDELAVAVFRV